MSKKHIFISYCHDNKKEVNCLYNDLISAGEQVWWDQNILPGQTWKYEIRKAIKESYAIILCFSKESQLRTSSGIYPEARDAIEEFRKLKPGDSFIFPVRLSECEIPPLDIDDTKALDSIQYVDLFPPSKRSQELNYLIEGIRRVPNHP